MIRGRLRRSGFPFLVAEHSTLRPYFWGRVAGVWVQQIAPWADLDAIVPLDECMVAGGTSAQQFLSSYEDPFAEMTQSDGHVHAL